MKPITTNGLVSKGRCLICRPLEACFPLHQAIILRLPIDAIDALSCPIALAEQCNGLTALHVALRHISAEEPDASWEVVKILLGKHPKAAREKDADMNTPLHLLAQQKAPLDLLSLFLRSWPDAITKRNKRGQTPLHYAFKNGAPLEAIIPLLDKWLETTDHRHSSDLVFMQNHPLREVNNLLNRVSGLFNNEVLDTSPSDAATHFINIELWNGVLLVINKHPAITKDFNLHTNVMADFLSMVGKRCSLTAMWEVIINEQDLLGGAE